MVSKTLVLLGLFAFLLVVSEMATASRMHPDMVKSKEETVKPNQQSYGGNDPPSYGRNDPPSYGGGGNNGRVSCSCCVRGYTGGCPRYCCRHAK